MKTMQMMKMTMTMTKMKMETMTMMMMMMTMMMMMIINGFSSHSVRRHQRNAAQPLNLSTQKTYR